MNKEILKALKNNNSWNCCATNGYIVDKASLQAFCKLFLGFCGSEDQ